MKFNWSKISWKAIGIGLVVGAIVAYLGEGTGVGELLLPDNGGYVLNGLVSGLVVGFVSKGSIRTGAYNGGLGGVIGGIVAALATTVLYGGVGVVSAIVAVMLLLVIPGIIGGAIGAGANRRRLDRPPVNRPA